MSPQRMPRPGQDVIIRTSGEVDNPGHGTRSWFVKRGNTFTQRMQAALDSGDFDAENDEPWHGQPWVTPIIGSGPLGLPTEFLSVCDVVPDAVVVAVEQHFDWSAFRAVGADHAAWMADFAHKLIAQHVGEEEAGWVAHPVPGADGVSVGQVAATIRPEASLLVLVAAQLTRTFHRISLDTARPISHWGTERATIHSDHPRSLDLRDEYVALLRRACTSAVRALQQAQSADAHHGSVLSSIAALVGRIDADVSLAEPRITLVHLKQVTEAAWYLLVDSVAGTGYPGWTNLLLRLVLGDDDNVHHGHLRPRWQEMRQLSEDVRTIVEEASADAWRLGNSTPDHVENSRFYDAVARTLWAQNSVRDSFVLGPRGDENLRPARPVGYVGSFDYELEMALWRTGIEFGYTTFSVVVPVYAIQSSQSGIGDFVWLEAVIETSREHPASIGERDRRDFDTMRTVKSWRVLNSRTPTDEFHHHPIIVRIVGCPLLPLPQVDEDLKEQLMEAGVPRANAFVHCVTVDEYLALRQTERDWIWSAHASKKHNPGLPSGYFSSGARSPHRYWMVMGVPFRDPAIRLRVLSVLARASSGARVQARRQTVENVLTPPTGVPSSETGVGQRGRFLPNAAGPENLDDETGEEPETRRYGVAINTRSDDEETMLLNSLGFSVVHGKCEEFTGDLDLHAAWLREGAESTTAAREDRRA